MANSLQNQILTRLAFPIEGVMDSLHKVMSLGPCLGGGGGVVANLYWHRWKIEDEPSDALELGNAAYSFCLPIWSIHIYVYVYI